MKLNEAWLREWINPPLPLSDIAEKLTMAGLEIESISPAALTQFDNVVVGEIIKITPHPEADNLQICGVKIKNTGAPLVIVCGANNIKEGMKVPTALIDAKLANDVIVKSQSIRGVQSQGMLCSSQELGLSEENIGVLELPPDAPVGADVWEFLNLSDSILEIAITPNRGDCLSLLGVTLEVAAITETIPTIPVPPKIETQIKDVLAITLVDSAKCIQYAGRIIRDIDNTVFTPVWMKERLRRGGVRSISAVVDVMNYVMLELGQPMHAFDLSKLDKEIIVRDAIADETLALLNEQIVTLEPGTLVIADKSKPLAIAGLMGGLDSGVTLTTKDIFLESALFAPLTILKATQKYHLSSESAYRYERGVDSLLQLRALERATELLLSIVGGKAGPITHVKNELSLPQPKKISLRPAHVERVLGLPISAEILVNCFKRLGFTHEKVLENWTVTVPTRRTDIVAEIDLIEEIARIYGYQQIPVELPQAVLQMVAESETKIPLRTIRKTLVDIGYHEVITYSFVNKNLLKMFDETNQAKELVNPINSDMSVMRSTLLPGLISTLQYNLNRQQNRVRIFETGLAFINDDNKLMQEERVAGLVCGPVYPLQWGLPTEPVDFYDLKGDVENLFKLSGESQLKFKPGYHVALHPGQTAFIYKNNEAVGILGRLHPLLMAQLDVPESVYLFEIKLAALQSAGLPKSKEISKFPEIRRDVAILVDRTIPAQEIQDTIQEVAGNLLKDVRVFDVYQGKGIDPDQKSVAIALILQHSSRTLVDDEVNNLMQSVVKGLKERFKAELRG